MAARLRAMTEVNSISAEDTFGLQADILEYLADMEQSAEGLGIHKVYTSYTAMVADAPAPVGSNGKALRYGQLVSIYDESNPSQSESGNVYAWQKGNTGASAWLLMGNLGDIKESIAGKVDKVSDGETSITDGGSFDALVDSLGNAVVKMGAIPEVGNGIQAEDFYDTEGNSLTRKIEEIDAGTDGMMPRDSIENEVMKDGSNHEVWCDKFGNIGMLLTGNGILKVSKIEGDVVGSVENAIAFPNAIYCLVGVQRNFWHQSLLSRWNPNDYYLQFGGTAPYQRRTPLVATIKEDALSKLDGKKMTLSLVDYRKMAVVQKIENVTVRAAHPKAESDGLGLIRVMFVGSSTTQSCYFVEALTRYVSNYELVGLRHSPPSNNTNPDPSDENFSIIHEAHGGCTLASFFGEPSTGATAHFFPFIQPNGNYRYWGATGFWKNAHLNKYTTVTQNDPDEPDYHPGAYNNGCYIQSALEKFDETTGLLENPTQYDIMYDNDNSSFIKWDGSEWQTIDKSDFTWTFQFGKYIDMWGLDTPDVVVVTLGSNDFRNADLPIDFSQWNGMITEFVASVKEKNSSAKLALCSQGPFGNDGYDGLPTGMLNYKCWLHFRNMIDVFGKMESQGVYVIDQTSELSAEYGFPVIMTGDTTASQTAVVHTFPTYNYPLVYPTELYHELYTHDGKGSVAKPYSIEQKMKVLNADSVHPQYSYANMGIPIAAFLQYIRQQQ